MYNQELDLIQAWSKLKEEKFTQHQINKTEIMNAINMNSSLTISQLKKRVKAKINWIIFFIIAFSIWMLIEKNNFELLLIIGFLNALYLISLVTITPFYKKMDSALDLTTNTLQNMQRNLNMLKNVLKIEHLFGLIGLPLSVVIGVLIKMNYKGFTIMETLQNEKTLLFILTGIIILVPLMFILTEKMNNMAFGQLKSQLEKNITKLELLEQ